MIKPNRGMVIMGSILLVVLQITTVMELFAKAREQNMRHFAIDLGILYGLACATGAILAEAFIYRKRRP